ncbi:MAG: hypothetical protein L6437_03605 [Kiritimatiellae bacterium]|nr:hypothetical protein [Kiritimatiellia bacterium]
MRKGSLEHSGPARRGGALSSAVLEASLTTLALQPLQTLQHNQHYAAPANSPDRPPFPGDVSGSLLADSKRTASGSRSHTPSG